MNQFIESFFDTNVPDFKLWSKSVQNQTIDESKVIFKGEMLKINRKKKKTKQRFFVLTNDHLYYLKSQGNNKIRGIMSTQWVRVQYIPESEGEDEQKHCVRFIKNMKYCDFLIKGQENFKAW